MLAYQIGNGSANCRSNFFSLLGSRRAARANSPNGFVSDGAILSFASVKASKRSAHLVTHKADGVAGIAHGKALTDAHDGVEARFGERANLLVHHGIGFTEIVATLRMAHDAPSGSHILEHGNACLARESARRLPMAVLSAHVNVRLVEIEHREH